MKAALYARVSTNDKDQNPETQLLQLRDYATRRNITVHAEYVDEMTGKQDSRPALNQIMKDARLGRFDAILVWRFDRFGRTVKQLILGLEEFRALGIEFISLSESIDTTTPYGKLLYVVIGAFAEFVADITRENVRAGLERAKREGKQLGRPKKIFQRDLAIASALSSRAIAHELGVSPRTIQRLRRKQQAESHAAV
jgi:DNA invertase Pin-like site-specific DNA recombinase